LAVERKINVSILSKNRLFRESLARILTKKHDLDVADESCAAVVVAARPQSGARVWVCDSLQHLVESGLPRSQDRKNGPAACVLVAMQEDAQQFMAAVRLGILGYVLQDASAADVVAAIRSAAQGEVVCHGRLTRLLFDYVASQKGAASAPLNRKQFRLTRRERQLVPLVDRGLTNKEIAAELSLSEQTIKSHIHRMLRKVGVEDRFSLSHACGDEHLSL
jgi:DNA-binding NarL/FixJ family response regulator